MRSQLSLRWADVGRLLAAWASSSLALMAAAAILPGLSATSPWEYVVVAGVTGVVGLLLRPIMVEVSARIGWIAVLALTLVGQAAIMYAALALVPGVTASFWTAIAASWIAAVAGTLIAWATTAGTDDGLVAALAHRGRRTRTVEDPDVDGVVFVQLDGVPYPVLRWAIRSGSVPTIRHWVTSGAYTLREWTPQLPCTTPASQLGILHGTIDGIPAFRWYDRELGRVLVANQPADARLIEDRASTGQGLLWDDGVSISNLFTGDAPRALLTMSRAEVRRGSTQTRRAFAWFFASPSGFTRSLTRTVAEIVKERWQARRQVRRDVRPRVNRNWSFAVLRAVTNALLRDLNTALVAEEMRRGTRSIYVDYVDYDEIAHHAGLFRPESLAALDGLDRVLASLEALAATAPRRYRIVVLSDHGQSQGTPFADRYGQDLGALCQSLMSEPVQTIDEPVEGLGRAESIVQDVAGSGGVVGRAASEVGQRMGLRADDHSDAATPSEPAVVLGSGNLGLLYLRRPGRLALEDLDDQWPDLLPGLLRSPGIAFVAGLGRDGHPRVVGAAGRHDLLTGAIEGQNPLAPFGEHAARMLAQAVRRPEAPDLYINSSIDEHTEDVAAFEGLVGAHGGLGGWQDSAVLLVPADLSELLPDRIEGADRLHAALVSVLRACGHRKHPLAGPKPTLPALET
jgi:uncharacterized membrane protein YvlD (DUF360 family)